MTRDKSSQMRNGGLADFDGVPGYIYLGYDGRSFKVGKTLCPPAREKQHKSSNPGFKLLRDWCVLDVGEAEPSLINRLKSFAVPGTCEWFNLPDGVIAFLMALDDWAFVQFVSGDWSMDAFHSTAAWNRLMSQRYVWFFIFNPYVILQFATAGQMPDREGIFAIYERSPILFLRCCRMVVAFKTPQGIVISYFDHTEDRRAMDGAKTALLESGYPDQFEVASRTWDGDQGAV